MSEWEVTGWVNPDQMLPPEGKIIKLRYRNRWGEEWDFYGKYENEVWWWSPLVVLSMDYGEVIGWKNL